VTIAPKHMPVIPIVRSANWSLGIVPWGAWVIQAATAKPTLTSKIASVAPSIARRTAVQMTGMKSRYNGWYGTAGANPNNIQTMSTTVPTCTRCSRTVKSENSVFLATEHSFSSSAPSHALTLHMTWTSRNGANVTIAIASLAHQSVSHPR